MPAAEGASVGLQDPSWEAWGGGAVPRCAVQASGPSWGLGLLLGPAHPSRRAVRRLPSNRAARHGRSVRPRGHGVATGACEGGVSIALVVFGSCVGWAFLGCHLLLGSLGDSMFVRLWGKRRVLWSLFPFVLSGRYQGALLLLLIRKLSYRG